MLNTKEEFLEKIKANGQSSPAGIHWHKFCNFLKRKSKVDDNEKLLTPLILGGSMCSHAVKFQRLSEHLEWAIQSLVLFQTLKK